jgi:hypothetical protein
MQISLPVTSPVAVITNLIDGAVALCSTLVDATGNPIGTCTPSQVF